MHQHLFLKFLWEWFCRPEGMLVWAEANQGMLSIAALVTALVFFLVEQRRANEAAAAAERLAVQERAAAEQKVADDKAFALELERRDRTASRALAAETVRAAAEAALREKAAQIEAYTSACVPMITDLAEIVKAVPPATLRSDSKRARMDRALVTRASEGRLVLVEVMRAAPLEVELIVSTQKAIAALEDLLRFADDFWDIDMIATWQKNCVEALNTAAGRMAAGGVAAESRILEPLTRPPSRRQRKA